MWILVYWLRYKVKKENLIQNVVKKLRLFSRWDRERISNVSYILWIFIVTLSIVVNSGDMMPMYKKTNGNKIKRKKEERRKQSNWEINSVISEWGKWIDVDYAYP